MSQPIQVADIGSALQYLFRLQGRVRPALEEFIVPTVLVGDVSQSSPPFVSRRATAQYFINATVGEKATMLFRAPANTLAVLHRIRAMADTTKGHLIANFGQTISDPAGVNTTELTDSRQRALSGQAVCSFLAGTQVAALPSASFRRPLVADTPVDIDLTPGWAVGGLGVPDAVELQFTTANVQLVGTFEWTEYVLVR